MGANESVDESLHTVQRIRPGPGISGYKLRRGNLSIYSDKTHTIYSVQISPDMTISDIKKQLPLKNIELVVDGKTLKNGQNIEELGIDNTTLIKICEVNHFKSNSTTDSIHETDGVKMIGPKKLAIEKPVKPPNNSSLSINEDHFSLDLKSFAVPDVKLKNSLSAPLQIKKRFI